MHSTHLEQIRFEYLQTMQIVSESTASSEFTGENKLSRALSVYES